MPDSSPNCSTLPSLCTCPPPPGPKSLRMFTPARGAAEWGLRTCTRTESRPEPHAEHEKPGQAGELSGLRLRAWALRPRRGTRGKGGGGGGRQRALLAGCVHKSTGAGLAHNNDCGEGAEGESGYRRKADEASTPGLRCQRAGSRRRHRAIVDHLHHGLLAASTTTVSRPAALGGQRSNAHCRPRLTATAAGGGRDSVHCRSAAATDPPRSAVDPSVHTHPCPAPPPRALCARPGGPWAWLCAPASVRGAAAAQLRQCCPAMRRKSAPLRPPNPPFPPLLPRTRHACSSTDCRWLLGDERYSPPGTGE